MLDYLDRDLLYRQPVLGENISLTILALDADIRYLKKEAVTVGDNEKTKLVKLKMYVMRQVLVCLPFCLLHRLH
jgi:hypothetical protein